MRKTHKRNDPTCRLVYFPKVYSKTLALSLAEKINYFNTVRWAAFIKDVKVRTNNNFSIFEIARVLGFQIMVIIV